MTCTTTRACTHTHTNSHSRRGAPLISEHYQRPPKRLEEEQDGFYVPRAPDAPQPKAQPAKAKPQPKPQAPKAATSGELRQAGGRQAGGRAGRQAGRHHLGPPYRGKYF